MAKEATKKSPDAPAGQASQLALNLSVDLKLGDKTIPLSTDGGIEKMTFSYDRTTATTGDLTFGVNEFANAAGVDARDLPTSLASLTVRIDTIDIDVDAKHYKFVCEIGSTDATAKTFTSSWTPIPEFDDFKLSNVKLEVRRGSKPDNAPAAAGGDPKG